MGSPVAPLSTTLLLSTYTFRKAHSSGGMGAALASSTAASTSFLSDFSSCFSSGGQRGRGVRDKQS